jgi:hypothetical protein
MSRSSVVTPAVDRTSLNNATVDVKETTVNILFVRVQIVSCPINISKDTIDSFKHSLL